MSKLYERRGPVEYEIDRRELAEGTVHELEHFSSDTARSRKSARKIALDHLIEIPDYYSRLARMEQDYFQYGGRKMPRKNPAAIDVKTALERLIDVVIETAWNKGVRRDKKLRAMTVGIIVSRWAEWQGTSILTAFHEALEDANYHAEAAEVRKLFSR